MYDSRRNNRKIKMLHETCLRIIYNYKQLSFIELLNKDNSILIHNRNIPRFSVVILKFYNGLSPLLMNNLLVKGGKLENPYNIRHVSDFTRPMGKRVYRGVKTKLSCFMLSFKKWKQNSGVYLISCNSHLSDCSIRDYL